MLVNHTRSFRGAHRQRGVDELSLYRRSRADSRLDRSDDACGARSVGPCRAVSRRQQRRHHSAGDLRGRAWHRADAWPTTSGSRWMPPTSAGWLPTTCRGRRDAIWSRAACTGSGMNSEGIGGNCFSGCFNFANTDRNNPGNTGYAFANALLGNFVSYSESSSRPLLAGNAQFLGMVRPGFLEGHQQPDARPRRALLLGRAVPAARGAAGRGFRRSNNGIPPAGRGCTGRRSSVASASGSMRQPARPSPVRSSAQWFPDRATSTTASCPRTIRLSYSGSWRKTPGIQPQPRLGFSWDPQGDRQTAIRGGFGVTKQVLQGFRRLFVPDDGRAALSPPADDLLRQHRDARVHRRGTSSRERAGLPHRLQAR